MSTSTIDGVSIWTADPARPRAHRLVLEGGRIAAVDDADPAGDRLDPGGGFVVPGLIDAHLHLAEGGAALGELDLSGVDSRRGFEDAIAERHARLATDRWLIARGWSNENWPDRALPDASWLAAAGDRPTVCYRSDLHAVLVNDAVLRQCDTSEAPPGGTIARHPDGTPTGLLVEAAAWRLVNPIVPKPGDDMRREAVLAAQRYCHRFGLTTVGTMEYGRTVATVFEPLRDRLTLRCRVMLLDRTWPLDFGYGRDFSGDDHLAVIGYKTFLDGTLGSRTARLLAPYADAPNESGTWLELAADGDLDAWAAGVAAEGFPPVMHAIGDAALRRALDIVHATDPALRPRIEHAQQIDPADVPRCRDVILSMQPLHRADDGRYAEARLGAARLAGTFAFRTLLDAGARLAFGSDWPVVSCDPVAGIRAAVTGLTFDGVPFRPEENLTVEEALHAYTAEAARAVRLDDAGVLRPGHRADLTVFDRDPFTTDWIDAPPRVVKTIVGGRVVYDAAADA